MRALSSYELVGYASEQIQAAEQILARHGSVAGGWCSCGRLSPCSVAGSAEAARQRYRASLAALDATMVLPVVRVPAARPRWWRRVLSRAR